jgi:N-methylhydantoinase B
MRTYVTMARSARGVIRVFNAIELGVFSSRLAALCEEMGAGLQRAAFSPNIKDRLDFSCAVFDARGQLCAQAAHIPVHLGSMAFAMGDLVGLVGWREGDLLILNDPYMGGTHLPDVTLVAPVFLGGTLLGFVANRAHHANIGAASPGSMPIARRLEEEGVVIPPTLLLRDGVWNQSIWDALCGDHGDVRMRGDFHAQASCCHLGSRRLKELMQPMGAERFLALLAGLNQYGETLARREWHKIPAGTYRFTDVMEDDGLGTRDIPIQLRLQVDDSGIVADFAGTSPQVPGNINCPLSVTAAAVYYALRCLLPDYAPACAGTFRPITLRAPVGSLVNAQRPAAVAAGNVETSSRLVDVMFGALALALPELIPAASQGTMNNLAMGSRATAGFPAWDYYETVAGGSGGGPAGHGLSARQTHMTNTLNTPVESIESHFPVRVIRYQIRRGSGGAGRFRGGDGVIREFEFLAPAQATLLTERRIRAPWGLNGAEPGAPGNNQLNGREVPAKTELHLQPGDRLTIATPGGGGWNPPGQQE